MVVFSHNFPHVGRSSLRLNATAHVRAQDYLRTTAIYNAGIVALSSRVEIAIIMSVRVLIMTIIFFSTIQSAKRLLRNVKAYSLYLKYSERNDHRIKVSIQTEIRYIRYPQRATEEDQLSFLFLCSGYVSAQVWPSLFIYILFPMPLLYTPS